MIKQFLYHNYSTIMLSRTPCKLLWISLAISLLRFSSALEWSSLYLAWWNFSWHLLLGSNVPFSERQPLSRQPKVTHHNVLCHLIIFFSTAHVITWSYALCIYSRIHIFNCLSAPSFDYKFNDGKTLSVFFSTVSPAHKTMPGTY